MCGRFINITKIGQIKKNFDIQQAINTYDDIISYNIAPSGIVNVVFKNKHLNIEKMSWGIKFLNKINQEFITVINSRLETIKEKMLFKESFLKKRCLIPANGYFEWKNNNGNKIPYLFEIPTLETFYFAGIWKYADNINSIKKTFSILTKQANNLISTIHSRMPVILNIDEAINYIDQDEYLIKNQFISYIEKDFDFYSISKIINNPRNNSKKYLEPLK